MGEIAYNSVGAVLLSLYRFFTRYVVQNQQLTEYCLVTV